MDCKDLPGNIYLTPERLSKDQPLRVFNGLYFIYSGPFCGMILKFEINFPRNSIWPKVQIKQNINPILHAMIDETFGYVDIQPI